MKYSDTPAGTSPANVTVAVKWPVISEAAYAFGIASSMALVACQNGVCHSTRFTASSIEMPSCSA